MVATTSQVTAARAAQIAALALLCLALGVFEPLCAGEFPLTPEEQAYLERGDVIVKAAPKSGPDVGTIYAAVRVAAQPSVVYRVMIDCAAALEYVPHLDHCAVIESAPDGSWQLIEQRLDYGWYAPALEYVMRADYERDRAVELRQVRGDFIVNEGRWELEPQAESRATLLRYRVRAVAPGFVPVWMQRRSLVRELPQLLRALRRMAEQAAAADLQSGPPVGKMARPLQ